MFKDIISSCKPAITLLAFFILLVGFLYPITITGLAQLFFSNAANGSLIQRDNKIIGSRLIGQSFTDPRYFWGRPSATTPLPYNGENSEGSNFGPSNPLLFKNIQDNLALLQADKNNKVPVDLVTASGSGLDPDISPFAAFYQIPRIAKARSLSETTLKHLVQTMIQPRTLGILGEPRVNVLQLNLALDKESL